MNEQQRQGCPHLDERRMLVVELKITGDQMIVARRDVNDLVVGDALARDGREHVHRHDKQQAEAQRLGLVCKNELLEGVELAP